MKLNDIRNAYVSEGASYLDATSRTGQDVVLALIAKSPLAKNVTIKGGVVMRQISGDSRRATQDLDLDFIKYSIGDDAILAFVEKMNSLTGDIKVRILEPIRILKHPDYSGKRVFIRITDIDGTSIDTKLDIGVHKNISPEQELYCFDLCKLDDSISLLVNTKEQIFVEKLKSFLRLGAVSTRYKDVFDMYYLATQIDLDKPYLQHEIASLIYDDTTIKENNIGDIVSRLTMVLPDPRFSVPFVRAKRHNWLEIAPEQAIEQLINFIKNHIV